MTCKTVYTCDHCGKEVPRYIGEQWRASFLTVGDTIDDIHACTKKHLGAALAKLFGLGQLPANSCTDAERQQYEITIRQKNERIAELEKQLAPIDVDGKKPGDVNYEAFRAAVMAQGASDPMPKWELAAQAVLRAFGGKRISELEAERGKLHADARHIAREALGRAREQINSMNDPETMNAWTPYAAVRVIDAEFAKLDDPQSSATFTDPTRPTKP